MTRLPQNVERLARNHPCTTCHALRGRPCRSSSGKNRSMAHRARFDAATASGRLPRAEQTEPMRLETR